MLRVAREVGLVKALDRRVQLLKRHVPYHESDHVLNFAINAWCDATCLQDMELRRNDEVFWDSIGADALPDPTTAAAEEIVFGCNDRCDQESLIAQLAGGVRSLSAPVDNLISNGASMVMTSLAWTLRSWAALLLPVEPRWREQHQAARRTLLTMEFNTFLNALVKIPCQIVTKSPGEWANDSPQEHRPRPAAAPRSITDLPTSNTQ